MRTARAEIDVIDPYPVGAGRIWRADQSASLIMNSPSAEVTLFPDGSCDLPSEGGIGPSLLDWLAAARLDANIIPSDLRDEAAGLTSEGFASRRLLSHYLRGCVDHIRREHEPRVIITERCATVTHVQPESDRVTVTVETAAKEIQTSCYDAVVLAIGHGSSPVIHHSRWSDRGYPRGGDGERSRRDRGVRPPLPSDKRADATQRLA